ncbi:MAG: ATP-binding protein [Negativicutes bacterium]
MRKYKYKKTAGPELEHLRRRVAELERLEKKRAAVAGRDHRERSLLYSVFEGLPAFIYLQAKDYSIRFANRAFRDRFGDPGTKCCHEVISGLDQPCPQCPTFRVFDTCEPQTWEWQPSRIQTFQIYDYPFFDLDGTPLVLELGIDISEAKNLENARTELFANVSHELRTPLMKIQGYVESLRDGFYADTADSRKQLDIISANVCRMDRLIGDLLDLAKLNACQSFQFQILPLRELLSDYFAELKLYLRKKQRRLTYSLPEIELNAKIDPGRFIQVLDNLIDNSLKHTPTMGRIHVAIDEVAEGVRFCVRDDGPGIASEDLPYVFSKFYRGNQKERKGIPEGLGLGLSIAQSIVAAHGGRIWVEEDQSNGDRISFILPLLPGERVPESINRLQHGETLELSAF